MEMKIIEQLRLYVKASGREIPVALNDWAAIPENSRHVQRKGFFSVKDPFVIRKVKADWSWVNGPGAPDPEKTPYPNAFELMDLMQAKHYPLQFDMRENYSVCGVPIATSATVTRKGSDAQIDLHVSRCGPNDPLEVIFGLRGNHRRIPVEVDSKSLESTADSAAAVINEWIANHKQRAMLLQLFETDRWGKEDPHPFTLRPGPKLTAKDMTITYSTKDGKYIVERGRIQKKFQTASQILTELFPKKHK